MYKYSRVIEIVVNAMKKVTMVWLMAALVVTMLLVTGFANAENLKFDKTVASGDVLDAKADLVMVGGSYDSQYQYFYFQTREPGFNAPPNDVSYTFSIDVEAEVNGEDVTQYVTIVLLWQNNGGNVTHIYTYSTHTGGGGTLSDSDVQISGSKVTVRVPAMLFKDVTVDNVDFTTGKLGGGFSGDSYIYYPNSNNNGGSGGTSGGSSVPSGPDVGAFYWMAGIGAFLCVGIWFVLWLIVAFWAYKDAKKKCNSSPGLWFVVVFLLGLIGIIIYVIVVKDECQKQQAQNYDYVPPPPQ